MKLWHWGKSISNEKLASFYKIKITEKQDNRETLQEREREKPLSLSKWKPVSRNPTSCYIRDSLLLLCMWAADRKFRNIKAINVKTVNVSLLINSHKLSKWRILQAFQLRLSLFITKFHWQLKMHNESWHDYNKKQNII